MDHGRALPDEAITSGAAHENFVEITIAHGGDPKVIENPSLLPVAQNEGVIAAPYDGYVTRCDALSIGRAAVRLGAGRAEKDDVIDHGVAVTVLAKLGDRVSAGEPLARVRYTEETLWAAQRHSLASAWEIANEPVESSDLIIERIEATTF
jgi:thymidine phosphorylase